MEVLYMEYIVIVLLVGIIALMWFKQPNKMTNTILDAVVKNIRDSEAELVMGVYNKLPAKIKGNTDSKVIADVVAYVVDLACDIIESSLKK